MKLVNVYSDTMTNYPVLFDLLAERTPEQSISHREMPSFKEHVSFCNSHPYQAWYMVKMGELSVGAVYLSKDDEIGIAIFKDYRGKGYGRAAIRQLIRTHGKRRYLANISPRNIKSQQLFMHLGFKLCQHTYEIDGDSE